MEDKARVPIAILTVLILVSLSLAGAGFYLLQKERAKNLALQQDLDNLRIEYNIAQTKLQEYQKTISDLEVKLEDAQKDINNLTTTLQQETAAKEEALNQIEQLKADLEQQKALRSDLETRLNQAQDNIEKAQAKLKELDAKKMALEAKIKDLEAQAQPMQAEGVQLGTIVVGPEAGRTAQTPAKAFLEQPASPLKGKVLVVNKDYNFIVINLGSKDGVSIGDEFSLYHDNKYLGDVKIGKVHDSMSAADFVSTEIKNRVREGDKVLRKAK